MKKGIFLLFTFSALSSFAAENIDVTTNNQTSKGTYADIIFSTDGGKLTTTGETKANNIIVNKDVSATIATGETTDWGFYYRLGLEEQKASISGGEGATKDNASLTFDGYILGTGAKTDQKYDLDISNLTLNLQRTHNTAANDKNNLLRAAYITLTDANLNILAPTAAGTSSEIQAYVNERVGGAVSGKNNFVLTRSSFDVKNGALLQLHILGGSKAVAINDKSIFNIDGKVLVNAGNNTLKNNSVAINVDATSNLTIGSTGHLSMVSSDAHINVYGTMTVGGYVITATKIRLGNGGKLIINSSNLTDTTGIHCVASSTKGDFNIYGNSTIEINAQNNFVGFCATKANTTLSIILGNKGEAEYLLALDYLMFNPVSTSYYDENTLTSGTNSFVYDFKSFENGDVIFKKETVSEDAINAALSNMSLDGVANKLTYSSVNINGTDYWVLNTVIPEPSTYAMIFGAIALGFVAYRRRK